jgi:hypothetical protein
MTIANAIFQLQHIHKQHEDMPVVIYDGVKEYEITDFAAVWEQRENNPNQMRGHARICFRRLNVSLDN